MAERNKNNPLHISDDAIDRTIQSFTGDPKQDLKYIQSALGYTRFGDILHHEFEVFRMGSIGWKIEVSLEQRDRFGVTLDKITNLGPEEGEDDEIAGSWDYVVGVELLRGFIAHSFVEQAKIEGRAVPEINDKILDSPPVRRAWLDHARAGRVGMTMMVTEDLDAQMQQENPRLYQETMGLKDKLVDRFTPRTLQLYRGNPEEFLAQYTPVIREKWEESLREMTLRTYGWFTPNQPNLVPVAVQSKG